MQSKWEPKPWSVQRTTALKDSSTKKCRCGLINLSQNVLTPVASIFLDLLEAARIAQPFKQHGDPFISKSNMLGFVGNVIAPGHGAEPVTVGERILSSSVV